MSGIKKKIVFLIYDADTAVGIDNYGRISFGYNLEDIDLTEGGEKVYAGQDSVLWKNVRVAFNSELTTMYRNLRSSGKFSYDVVNRMFEEHQAKWPEALKLEDSNFKYIIPYVENGEDRLAMCLGFKKEQRKWWLYNRFKYIDSKYNAGDAAADSVSMRSYYTPSQGETYGINITPYADIYATVLYGVAPSSVRAPRNVSSFVKCPLDHMEFTDTYIYSASQIKDFGDLFIFRPDAVEFSKATNAQVLRFGSATSGYTNPNLKSLSLGNNKKLKILDIRNCVNLGIGDQKTLPLVGCTNIEEVYADGTALRGVSFPNGGILKKLHLPGTVQNFTLQNQRFITEFNCPDYSNITTLRLENNAAIIPVREILGDISENSRVRIIGFNWEFSTYEEISTFYDLLDTFRGLDENGNNMDKAQVSGVIHIPSLTGAQLAGLTERYPYITIDADATSSVRTYANWDGTVLKTVNCLNGVPQDTAPSTASRTSTAQHTFTFIGWSLNEDSQVADFNVSTLTKADTTVYAAYSRTVRTYTVTWKDADGTTLETDNNVPYGTTPTYNGATPSYNGQVFTQWTPTVSSVTGNVTYTASYIPVYNVYFYNGTTLLKEQQVQQGGNATPPSETPIKTDVENPEEYTFTGWSPSYTNIQGNTSCYAQFVAPDPNRITDDWETIIQKISNGTADYQVGNYKPLDLGSEGIVNMQIIGKNTSPLASGNGTAMYDWLSVELLKTDHRMNPSRSGDSGNYTEGTGAIGGWEKCEMRTYLKETIKPLIPATVRNAIKEVTKYSTIYNSAGSSINNVASTEDVWIPSYREMFGSGETQGPRYDSIFPDNASRVKKKVGASSASWWWLRSANNSNVFYYVGSSGAGRDNTASTSGALALGFSI